VVSEQIGQGTARPHCNATRARKVIFGHSSICDLIVRSNKQCCHARLSLRGDDALHLSPVSVIDKGSVQGAAAHSDKPVLGIVRQGVGNAIIDSRGLVAVGIVGVGISVWRSLHRMNVSGVVGIGNFRIRAAIPAIIKPTALVRLSSRGYSAKVSGGIK